MQPCAIICEAIECDFPCSVLQNASIEDIYVVSVVSRAPFDCQYGNMALFQWNRVIAIRFPRVYGDWGEALILRFSMFASVFNNLIPRMLDSFFLLTQLPQNICKVNQRLAVCGFQFQRFLAKLKSFLKLVQLHVHNC